MKTVIINNTEYQAEIDGKDIIIWVDNEPVLILENGYEHLKIDAIHQIGRYVQHDEFFYNDQELEQTIDSMFVQFVEDEFSNFLILEP